MNQIVKDAVAGIAGGSAMMAAMAGDLAVFHNRTDDRLLLGGIVEESIPKAKTIGLGMHFVASAALGVAHGIACRSLDIAPTWKSGLAVAMIENTSLYPLVMFERYHPSVQRGDLQSFLSPLPIAQEAWRHVAFGTVMGLVAGRLRD